MARWRGRRTGTAGACTRAAAAAPAPRVTRPRRRRGGRGRGGRRGGPGARGGVWQMAATFEKQCIAARGQQGWIARTTENSNHSTDLRASTRGLDGHWGRDPSTAPRGGGAAGSRAHRPPPQARRGGGHPCPRYPDTRLWQRHSAPTEMRRTCLSQGKRCLRDGAAHPRGWRTRRRPGAAAGPPRRRRVPAAGYRKTSTRRFVLIQTRRNGAYAPPFWHALHDCILYKPHRNRLMSTNQTPLCVPIRVAFGGRSRTARGPFLRRFFFCLPLCSGPTAGIGCFVA